MIGARLAALERYVRPRGSQETPRCELCGAALEPEHAHVVDRSERQLRCACRACALLFDRAPAGTMGDRYRTVPRRVRRDPDWTPSVAQWDALGVPVSLAFFFYASSVERWVGVFPSPGGPIESELPDSWMRLREGSRLIHGLEPDVEALLVRRERGGSRSCFAVPIDFGYQLVGLVRRAWRGVDGGDEARALVDGFFERLERQAGEDEG